MTFNYNNKEYELMEMVDPNSWAKSDCLIIMEIEYVRYVDNTRVLIKKSEYENDELATQEYRFINYFYGVEDDDTNVENAKYFIDHEYDKNFSELKYLLMELKKAINEFENDFENNNDTKGSLDRLEYAQSDIYDYVKKNIKGE